MVLIAELSQNKTEVFTIDWGWFFKYQLSKLNFNFTSLVEEYIFYLITQKFMCNAEWYLPWDIVFIVSHNYNKGDFQH